MTVTPMLVSGHTFVGFGATAGLVVAAAVLLADGFAPAELVELVALGETAASELERPATSHQSAARTVRTTSTTAIRRTQYTDGGSGPLGVITPLTMDTLVAATSTHATIHSWRDHRRKSLRSSNGLRSTRAPCHGVLPTSLHGEFS